MKGRDNQAVTHLVWPIFDLRLRSERPMLRLPTG